MKKVKNHVADISNKNIGTPGINRTIKLNLDNKADQLNPNNPKFIPKKDA